MKTLTEELQDKIYNALEGKKFSNESTKEIISSFTKTKTRFVDEKIDDGADGEDDYVMKTSYQCEDFDDVRYVDVYFGNNTRTISYIHFN